MDIYQRKGKEMSSQLHCPDCNYKTEFVHINTAYAQLRKHRALERAIALHPAGKKFVTNLPKHGVSS
jgi:hypothetical protein